MHDDLHILDGGEHLIHAGTHDQVEYEVEGESASDTCCCAISSGIQGCCDTSINLVWQVFTDLLSLNDQIVLWVSEVIQDQH